MSSDASDCESGYGESTGERKSSRDSLHEKSIGPIVLQRLGYTIRFTGSEEVCIESPKKTKENPIKCKMCWTEDAIHYSCAHCDEQFYSKLSIISHLRNHRKPENKCHMCAKTFTLNRYLQEHMTTHSTKQCFTCNVCEKKFKRKTSLTMHKLTHQPKRFHCEKCPKTFTQKSHLQVHIRRHTGEKPYVCSFCYKEFTQRTSLNNHILMHKGIKPHSCEFCTKEFRQLSNLRQHMQKNHPDEYLNCYNNKNKNKSRVSLVWYSCKNCRTVLTTNVELDKHIKHCHK